MRCLIPIVLIVISTQTQAFFCLSSGNSAHRHQGRFAPPPIFIMPPVPDFTRNHLHARPTDWNPSRAVAADKDVAPDIIQGYRFRPTRFKEKLQIPLDESSLHK